MSNPEREQVLRLNIQNLGCANCAAKMETAIRKLPGVRQADINFAAGRIRLVLAGSVPRQEMLARIDEIVHSIEKDACILAGQPVIASWRQSIPWPLLIRLFAGLPFYIGAWLLPGDSGVRLPLFVAAWLIFGYDVLLAAFANLRRKQIFDENVLMTVATAGALAIGDYPEAVAVMLFFQVGDFFQKMAVTHSRHSIRALMDIRPEQASLITGEGVSAVDPQTVNPGDRLLVRPGERIPLDSRVLDGESSLDTSALTGESMPRPVAPGDEVLAGCINGSGLLTVEAIRPFGESAVSRILSLVEEATARKASAEQFITRFAAVYTPIMVGLALVLALAPPLLLGEPFALWISRALILLVISCPCALVLSVPLGYFAGLGAASSRGILVKGGTFLEKLAIVETVVLDKTGTLTEGRFAVTEIVPAAGRSETAILRLAALAESYSSHPIAESVIRAWQSGGNALPEQSDADKYQDLPGRGIVMAAGGQQILLGNDRLLEEYAVGLPELRKSQETDGTVLYMAIDGEFAGEIWLSDQLKPGAARFIDRLRQAGVRHVALLSGDRWPSVRRIASQAGIDTAYAEMLPDQKVEALEAIIAGQGRQGSVVYIGDGINDAPVLARADVGIALGAGSDAAIESADIVILSEDLDKVVDAIGLARRTSRIIRQNITLALGLKVLVLILAVFGAAGIWQAVFADVGVAILAVFNSLRVVVRR